MGPREEPAPKERPELLDYGLWRWKRGSLEARWEVLESCERTVQDRGKIRLASDHLALVTAGEGELVRVGAPPRVEMAGWRYGDRLPMPGLAGRPLRRLLSSLFSRLPC